MFDKVLAQLKVEVEYLPLDNLEWKVLADLYEEHGDNDMAAGLRSCIEGGYEPVYHEDTQGRIPEDFLRRWPTRTYFAEEEPFFLYPWRWQSKLFWNYNPNYVVPVVFDLLNGKPFDRWKMYGSRVEAIFDLVDVSSRVFGPFSWPKRLED